MTADLLTIKHNNSLCIGSLLPKGGGVSVAFREYYIVIVKFESVTYLYVKRWLNVWFQVHGQCNSAPVIYIGPMSAQCRTPSSCHSNDNVTLAQCWEVLAGSATETSLQFRSSLL